MHFLADSVSRSSWLVLVQTISVRESSPVMEAFSSEASHEQVFAKGPRVTASRGPDRAGLVPMQVPFWSFPGGRGSTLPLLIAALGQNVDMVTSSTALVLMALPMCKACGGHGSWGRLYRPVHTYGCGVIALCADLARNFENRRHFERSWAEARPAPRAECSQMPSRKHSFKN